MPDDGRELLVPDLGEGLEEATIVRWLVAIGADVTLNHPLCVVETAKAEVEIPSPFAGRLLEHGGDEGDTLAVGTLLARIGPAGDAESTGQNTGVETAATGSEGERPAVLVGYGTDASHDRSRRTWAPRSGSSVVGMPGGARGPDPSSGSRPLAKPPVRKLARSLGVDLAALSPGSGPAGTVTRDDVLAASPSGGPHATVQVPGGGPADQTVPVRGVRARIAERMVLSRSRIPDATCTIWVDCTQLLATRDRLDEAAGDAGQPPVITPFALLCRLLVEALRRHRLLNATFVEDGPAIRIHGAVHLGIATATERGLVVAVVRDADRRSTLDLAAEMGRLAGDARAGTLPPAEMVGSTFTVSNLGALGLDEGIPVINYPEAAILGVGSIKERPVVVADKVVARPTAALTLAFDHRVCDGADAAAFIGHLRDLVERPELALLHS
jgi:2-oxoisovalerate dehydrogenase E2 component (dihydrolipoyl transacylase)